MCLHNAFLVLTLYNKLNSSTSKTHSLSMIKMSFLKWIAGEGAEGERENERVYPKISIHNHLRIYRTTFCANEKPQRQNSSHAFNPTRFIRMLNAFFPLCLSKIFQIFGMFESFLLFFFFCVCVQSHKQRENKNEMHEKPRKINVMS